MAQDVTVRRRGEPHLGFDVDAAENQAATWHEAMYVVANADSAAGCALKRALGGHIGSRRKTGRGTCRSTDIT